MPECNLADANVQAFLKLIRYAEHYPDTSDDFYDTLYGGGRFTGYTTHPNTAVAKWGHTSTAAGAYQILYPTWAEAHKQGIVPDSSVSMRRLAELHARLARPAGVREAAYARSAAGGVQRRPCRGVRPPS